MSRAGWGLLGLLIGAVLGWAWRSPPAPVVVDPGLRDSLELVRARGDSLEAEVARAALRSRFDSVALARSRNVRVVAAAPRTPADTVLEPDTVTVYEVPAPVALKVLRLEQRVSSLQLEVHDLQTLNANTTIEAELAATLQAQAEHALGVERGKKWRYRLEGAAVGGPIIGLALLLLLL